MKLKLMIMTVLFGFSLHGFAENVSVGDQVIARLLNNNVVHCTVTKVVDGKIDTLLIQSGFLNGFSYPGKLCVEIFKKISLSNPTAAHDILLESPNAQGDSLTGTAGRQISESQSTDAAS